MGLTPALVYSPHPLLAHAERALYSAPFLPGESIVAYMIRVGLNLTNRPVVLHLNDRPVTRGEWATTFPRGGDLITVRVVAQGGGGDDQNKTLRTVLTIAVLIVSIYTGGATTPLYGALVSVGGTLAVNALLPYKPPQLPLAGGVTQESPTYSLSGGSNQSRPFAPMPVVSGEHRVFPDNGATPYTTFVGEDQYLYQIFNFGLADITLSDYRIGATPLTSYSDYQIEESGADGKLTLFPTNVDTQAGGDLTQAAGYVTKTSSTGATELGVEIAGYLFYAGDNGLTGRSVDISIEYRAVGSGVWLPFVDGSATVSLNNSTRKPLRLGYRMSVASGQYEVRCSRVTPDETDQKATSDISWTQLLTFQPDNTTDYTGQKRVALKIKASGQLNGTVSQFSALAIAAYDVWNGSSWVNQASSNPAWQILWWARGKYNGSRLLCGGGLDDGKIDIENLKDFAAWCDLKGLTCNLVLDREQNFGDLLNAIAACGRGTITWASGKMGVVWDASNQPSVAMFGMSNMRRDSFRIDYADAPDYDEIIGRFVNPDNDWQQDTVRIPLAGVASPVRGKTVDLWGCTDQAQAGREVALLAAEMDYRYRRIIWQSDLEGRVCDRGDVVSLTHDLTKWGYSGRLVGASNTGLTLSRVVPFSAGLTHYVRVRYPDGSEYIWDVVYTGDTDTLVLAKPIKKTTWAANHAQAVDDEIEPIAYNGHFYKAIAVTSITGATEPTWPLVAGATVMDGGVTWQEMGAVPPYSPDNDPDFALVDYVWFFQPEPTPGKRVKILSVKPVSQYMIEFTAVDEDDNFYIRESDAYTYVPPSGAVGATPILSNIKVDEHLIRVASGYMVRLIITWDVTGDYSGARVNLALDGAPITNVGGSTTRRYEVDVQIGNSVRIEVIGLNSKGISGAGSKQTLTHVITGTHIQISDVAGFGFSIESYGIRLHWYAVPDATLRDYELSQGASFATATVIDDLTALEKRINLKTAGSFTFWIVARDQDLNPSLNPQSVTVTITGPSGPIVTSTLEGSDVVLSWTAAAGNFAITDYEILEGDVYASATSVTTLKAKSWRTKASWSGSKRFWIVGIDAAGNYGTASSVDMVITPPSQPSVSQQVIDNNVLLYWATTAGTLPVVKHKIYKGVTFAAATLIGESTGTFMPLFETAAGTYIYWLEPYDSADNAGTPGSVVANVNEPPDYVLKKNWISDYSGTKSNALIDTEGALLMPVVTTETWAQHFTNHSWTKPSDQITAGYPYYVEPSTAGAYYEEIFDYGAVLAGTLVSIVLNSQTITGAGTITPTISVRKLVTDAWTDYAGLWQVFATQFQYVKVHLAVAASGGDDLIEFLPGGLQLKLDVKRRYDGGNGTANAADSGGTTVNFNRSFIDVDSITVTPKGTTAAYGLYDFTDVPYPASFKVLLFNNSGTRVSGDFSWSAEGN